ncbi:MAG: hypothetical protein GWN58_13970 [Anaerolineae bacterium]|nr:hypothetical protein [Anaerolineae bacterium]
MSRRYYDALSDARVFIYPGISRHHWESKRMWEALACACAVMICRPQLDTSDYPIDELFPDPLLVCDTPTAIVPNCTEMLMGMEDEVAQWQQEAAWVAYTYFTPVPIARYALHKILEVS